MSKTLSPSKEITIGLGLTRGQATKLVEMAEHGLLKSSAFATVPTTEVDEFVKHVGPDIRDALVEITEQRFQAFASTARCVVAPLKATETNLIPKDWGVECDHPEGKIDLTKLDFSFSEPDFFENGIKIEEILKRADSASVIGSLGFCKIILDAQAEGKDIIPKELCGMKFILFYRTILRGSFGGSNIPFLIWEGMEEGWVLSFLRFDDWYHSRPGGVVPRVRE